MFSYGFLFSILHYDFWIFIVPSFLIYIYIYIYMYIYIYISDFHGIMVSTIFIYQQHFRIFLILSFLICNFWWWIFQMLLFVMLFSFINSLLSWYLFLTVKPSLLWNLMIFFLFCKRILFSSHWSWFLL